MTPEISKLVYSWLFIDPLEHYHTSYNTDKFNHFFKSSLHNIKQYHCKAIVVEFFDILIDSADTVMWFFLLICAGIMLFIAGFLYIAKTCKTTRSPEDRKELIEDDVEQQNRA